MINTSVFYQNGIKKTEFVSDRFFLIFNGELCPAVITDFGVPVEVIESELPLGEKELEKYNEEQALTRFSNELTGQNDPDLICATETLIEQKIKEES